jgi:SprT protein
MTNTQSVKQAIISSVHHFIDVANEKLDANMEYPRIDFTVKGSCGGKAYGSNRVNFNIGLAVDNLAEYVNQVAPHEVAHLVVNKKWGREIRVTRTGKIQRISHGDKFYSVMRAFGVREERCHSMDTSKVKQTRKTAQYTVVCTGCGFEGHVGAQRAKKIMAGHTYVHSCGNRRRAPIKLK